MTGALLHPDGRTVAPGRAHGPDLLAYHDTEWGVPEYDGRALSRS